MPEPEQTVMVELGGREVEMRRPTDGALVVLSRTFRGLPKIENVVEVTEEMASRLARDLGTLGKIVDGMIVNDDDKDFLDDSLIDGTVSAEEIFGAIRIAGEKLNGTAVAKKAAAPVRRARTR